MIWCGKLHAYIERGFLKLQNICIGVCPNQYWADQDKPGLPRKRLFRLGEQVSIIISYIINPNQNFPRKN
jgi:hypothetical protein